jgi:AcrR family transcriptional regulator
VTDGAAPAGGGSLTRRGRPPRHSRDEIVAAAVEIADGEGLDGVTMRAVAARLGTGVMSLYSYVPDKRALVHAMVEHVAQQHVYPRPSGDWRVDLHRVARAQRATLLRHPWALDADTVGQPPGPALLACLEFVLGALEPLDLAPGQRLETASLVTGSVTTLVRAELTERAERAEGAAGAVTPRQQAAHSDELARLLGTGRYPRVAAEVGARRRADARPGPGADFDRLLDRFLDGLVPHR